MHEQDLIQKCNFSFKCSKVWGQLLPTKDSNRRFCNGCQRDVYYIDSQADLIKAKNNGYCVAVQAKIDRFRNNNLTPEVLVVGMLKLPSPKTDSEHFAEISNYIQQSELTIALNLIRSWTRYNRQHRLLDQLFSQIIDCLENSRGDLLKVLINDLISRQVSCPEFEVLAIIAADRGHFSIAIEIANAIYICYESQARAVCLTKIACRIAKSGDVSKAINLLACCWHLSVTDSRIARKSASDKNVIQLKTMTEIIIQMLETNSLELTMKMAAGSTKSMQQRNQILSAIPLQFQLNSLLN